MGGWHDEDTGSRTRGGYKGRSKPSYGWSNASDGRKHDLIGYSEVRNAKSYSSETQQVVEVRRGGGAGGADYGLDYAPQIHDGSTKRRNQHHLLAPWLAAAPELHEREDSPKPVHLMAHSGGPKDNNPPRNNRHSSRNPHGRGTYRDSSDEEDDDDDEDEYNSNDSDSDNDNDSVFSAHIRRHGYPKAHERPNGHNHTQVNPSVPVTTYYESKPLAAGPPRMKTGAAPDHFRKKSPPQTVASAPVGAYLQPQYNAPSQRKGKGHQGAETRRRYLGGEMPGGGYPPEQYNEPIDCREAAERFNGVFLSGNNKF